MAADVQATEGVARGSFLLTWFNILFPEYK